MKSKNKIELEKAIDECQASGFRELMTDVEKANNILVSVGGKRRGQNRIISLFLSPLFKKKMFIIVKILYVYHKRK